MERSIGYPVFVVIRGDIHGNSFCNRHVPPRFKETTKLSGETLRRKRGRKTKDDARVVRVLSSPKIRRTTKKKCTEKKMRKRKS